MPTAPRSADRRSRASTPPVLPLLLLATQGCLPYTSGLTARPVPEQTVQSAVTVTGITPGALLRDSIAGPFPWPELSVRWPLDRRTDIGVRILSTMILSLRRQVVGDEFDGVAGAIEGAVGITFEGKPHAGITATVSGPETGTIVPYGGVRGLLSGTGHRGLGPPAGGQRDTRPMAAFGGFLGLRLGGRALGVAPELGVFVVRDGFAPFASRVVLVPGVTIHRLRTR